MPLGEEYDLSPVATDTGDAGQETYSDAVDTPWTQEVEAEADALLAQYNEWPTIPTYEATPENQYRNARNHVGRVEYSAAALEAFVTVADFDRSPIAVKPGLFLSAAVEEFEAGTVTLPDLSGVDYCFYRNETDVTVEGSVGDYAGHSARSGSITIKGDVGSHCGRFMEDGSITVEGDAGRALGHGMRSGSIHVHRDADDLPGLQKKGGTITVDGATGRPPTESENGSKAGNRDPGRLPA